MAFILRAYYFISGSIYLNDKHFKDLKKAEEYYKKACELGDLRAYNNLGCLYHHEIKDYKKAEECYLKACELKSIETYHNLGHLYHHDIKDYEKAKEYYLKACEFVDINSYFNLGYSLISSINFSTYSLLSALLFSSHENERKSQYPHFFTQNGI